MTTGSGLPENRLIAGRYEIVKLAGQGGMSKVYRGLDTVLNRPVAIKLLREELIANPDFVQRFQREAQAVASLPDDYIPGIYDYGQEGNTYYIITEFVEGQDLKKLIQQKGKLSPERAAEVAEQLLYALKAAHEQGMVHRDVKPQNILVRASDGRIKLTDFGVARARNAKDSAQATAVGTVIGTAAYMSPEQARGETVGPPTDFYATGIVLYEMLTGTLPYQADSTMEVLMAHIHQPIPDMRGLPFGLANVIRRAMAKNPAERYQSADQMLRDLKQASASQEAPTTYLPNQAAYSEATAVNYALPPTPPPVYNPQRQEMQYQPAIAQQTPPRQPVQYPDSVNPPTAIRQPATAEEKPRRNWLWAILLGILLIGAIAFLVVTVMRSPNDPQAGRATTTAGATTAAGQTTAARTGAAGQPISIKITPDQLDGAYERDDKTLFGRQTRALYGAGSGFNEGRVTVNLAAAPTKDLAMRIIGLDDERDPARCELEIIINGTSIYRKNNFFPNTPRNDNGVGGGDRYWGDMVVEVPASSLKAGNNTIIFRNNTAWTGSLGIPYMLLNNIFIS